MDSRIAEKRSVDGKGLTTGQVEDIPLLCSLLRFFQWQITSSSRIFCPSQQHDEASPSAMVPVSAGTYADLILVLPHSLLG